MHAGDQVAVRFLGAQHVEAVALTKLALEVERVADAAELAMRHHTDAI